MTRLRMVSIVLAATLALAGCSSSGGDGGSSDAVGGSGGTLVVGVTSDPDTLFPWKATQFQAVNVLGLLYGTLTELDKDLATKPSIAEKWEYSDDAKTLTLHLRKDVTFADGSALTSEDVKYSLETIKDEKTAAVAAASLAAVDTVEASDPQTVVLHLGAPDAGLVASLASVNLAILKKGSTEAELTTKANGTGPFTLGARTPNQSMTLEANEKYYGGAPKLDSVEFRVIPDETSVVAALQSGDVQMATLDDPLVAKTAGGGNITIAKTPQLSYHALQLKASTPPLDDVNVRLAIQCAIDRQQVIDTAAAGEGQVTGPITSPLYKSDPQARPCPTRDVAKAKDYLAKSKHPNGVHLKTIVSQGEYATSVNEAQNLKSQLAEAGITLDLEVMEIGSFVDKWVAADFHAAVALNGGRPDPDTMYGRYFTSKGNLNKVAGYHSATLDQLFAKGKATTDEAARKPIYADISKELEDQAVWIWLFTGNTYTAMTKGVSGFTPMPTGSLQYLRDASVK